ncbi:cysteine desulfurase family protein [Nanoarchaeota archaeon]
MTEIYLDNAATTRPALEAVHAMLPYLEDNYGNPSSLHQLGRQAKEALQKAREQIAKKINAEPEEIIFTSGGTESNNLAIKGLAAKQDTKKKNHIITSNIEHPAILNVCKELKTKGFSITIIPVEQDGIIDPKKIKAAITPKTFLISIMHVNNEIGTIQPIEEIAAICKDHKIKFHTDAVQSFTKIPIDTKALPADMISISSHKIHGPKGIGALFIRGGTQLHPLTHGGGQERIIRPGTENIPGVVGFGTVSSLTSQEDIDRMNKLRIHLTTELLKIPHTKLNGHPDKRLCNNTSISFHFVEGEALLMHLDLAGIAISTGSACSSMQLEASHVLLALGLPHEIAHGTLRFSLSKYTSEEDIDKTIVAVKESVEKLRKISPLKEGIKVEDHDNHEHHDHINQH